MRKELLWAGIIGISFGLIIGFGVWRVRSTMTPKSDIKPTPTPQTKVGQSKIVIDKPENFSVTQDSPINVTGVTNSLTWVIVSTENGDFIGQSLEDGTFNVVTDLDSGVNHLKATSINPQGNTSSQNLITVFSESFQTPSPIASTEADIKKVAADKFAAAQKPPKAYIGSVTDIADSTIQIKSIGSEIQQIATNKLNVAVVNTKGTNNKAVKLTDIAIGDFIVAMGYVDGNDVLDVQRILITDSISEPTINISIKKVTNVSKKNITVTDTNGTNEATITIDKNTDIKGFSDGETKDISLSNISNLDLIIVVSDTSGSPALTRTIFNIGSTQ